MLRQHVAETDSPSLLSLNPRMIGPSICHAAILPTYCRHTHAHANRRTHAHTSSLIFFSHAQESREIGFHPNKQSSQAVSQVLRIALISPCGAGHSLHARSTSRIISPLSSARPCKPARRSSLILACSHVPCTTRRRSIAASEHVHDSEGFEDARSVQSGFVQFLGLRSPNLGIAYSATGWGERSQSSENHDANNREREKELSESTRLEHEEGGRRLVDGVAEHGVKLLYKIFREAIWKSEGRTETAQITWQKNSVSGDGLVCDVELRYLQSSIPSYILFQPCQQHHMLSGTIMRKDVSFMWPTEKSDEFQKIKTQLDSMSLDLLALHSDTLLLISLELFLILDLPERLRIPVGKLKALLLEIRATMPGEILCALR